MKFYLILGITFFQGVRWYLFINQKVCCKNKNIIDINNKSKKIFFILLEMIISLVLVIQLLFSEYFIFPFRNNFVISVGIFLFSGGLIFSTWARLSLGKNWNTLGDAGIKDKHQLVTTGPFAICRHPIYVGTFFFCIGFEIILTSWLFFFLFPALIIFSKINARKEDKLLEIYFGKTYREYREKVLF